MAANVNEARMAVKPLPRARLPDIPWRPLSAEKAAGQQRVRPWPSPVRPSAVNKDAA